MGFNKFAIQLYLRFGLLLVNLIAIAFLAVKSPYTLLPIALGLVAFVQIFELIQLIQKQNKKISKFIFSLKHADYNSNYLEQERGAGFDELNEAFQLITDRLKENKLENESYLQFLNAIVEQIRIGLITINSAGEVKMMNHSAIKLLNLPNLKKWHRFEEKSPEFAQAVNKLGESQKTLLSIAGENRNRQLAIHFNSIKLLGEKHKIITFYDIKNELERKEIDSYNKLISILTHEIMNSVTPLNSLTDTVGDLVRSEDGGVKKAGEILDEDVEDIAASISTIQKRSKGMLNFIHDYRKIAKIPEPSLNETAVKEIFQNIHQLMQSELDKKNIELQCHVQPAPLKIYLDQGLVEQVLINLIINASHAIGESDKRQIELKAYPQEGRKIIEVKDYGKGISAELIDKIFVPFFSTKKTGSGIGLSLSQQIMQKHGGNIEVKSKEGEGSTFQLIFRF